jgi:hypothetical protein
MSGGLAVQTCKADPRISVRLLLDRLIQRMDRNQLRDLLDCRKARDLAL